MEEVKGKIRKPIGYFQYYLAADNLIGIDQFIGEKDYLNRGVGGKTIKMFVEMIIRRLKPDAVILDPSPENKRAIRCYEKIGFKYDETLRAENGHSAYMTRFHI